MKYRGNGARVERFYLGKWKWTGRSILVKQQLIHMKFLNVGGLHLYITFTYTSNEERIQRELWSKLVNMAPQMRNKKWLI